MNTAVVGIGTVLRANNISAKVRSRGHASNPFTTQLIGLAAQQLAIARSKNPERILFEIKPGNGVPEMITTFFSEHRPKGSERFYILNPPPGVQLPDHVHLIVTSGDDMAVALEFLK